MALSCLVRHLSAEELRILRGEQEVDEANLRLGDLDEDEDDEDLGDDLSQVGQRGMRALE